MGPLVPGPAAYDNKLTANSDQTLRPLASSFSPVHRPSHGTHDDPASQWMHTAVIQPQNDHHAFSAQRNAADTTRGPNWDGRMGPLVVPTTNKPLYTFEKSDRRTVEDWHQKPNRVAKGTLGL